MAGHTHFYLKTFAVTINSSDNCFRTCVHRHHCRCNLKTGFNEFPLFKTKLIKGYIYASVILENIKKNICARLIDDFDAEKYCDRNWREPAWQCRKSAVMSLGDTHGSPRYSAFGVRCWKIPSPDSWLSWVRPLLLYCDVIGIGGSEWNSHKARAAQLSVEGSACILSVTTAESHEYSIQ